MIPVHVGLFGHVDHGKTELARALSETISTAGLDKHPEAKRRQMTIDIGFTAFTLGDYLVTLVDVPGHADLIRTAVSGASIIDAAILVVSAMQGPQVQTGEHLVLLESLEIGKLVVALTHVDLAEEERAAAVKESIRNALSGSRYRDAPIVSVSSTTGLGVSELKKILLSILSPPERDIAGKFKMIIDHSFPIRGTGTVITGTIMRGRVEVGNNVEIAPLHLQCRVRSIQTFKEEREAAEAGDRVGIALQGIDYRNVYRGCYVCSPKSLTAVSHILAVLRTNKFFRHEISPGMWMHVTVGMSSIQAKIFPYEIDSQQVSVVRSVREGAEFHSYIKPSKPIIAEKGDKILVSMLSLPPTSLRIAAGGIVGEVLTGLPSLMMVKEKIGVVSRTTKSALIVTGLAKSRVAAERIIGSSVLSEDGSTGTVSSPFGGKGLVVVDFAKAPSIGEKVSLRRYRELNIS